MKKYKKQMRWIGKSLEDRVTGGASSRKLTAFVGMLMMVITWICDLFFDMMVSDLMLYGILIMTGLSFGLFTAENVVQILKRNNYNDFFQQGNILNSNNTEETDGME